MRELARFVEVRNLHIQSFVAQILPLLANPHRDFDAHPKPYTFHDFYKPRKQARPLRRSNTRAVNRTLSRLPPYQPKPRKKK